MKRMGKSWKITTTLMVSMLPCPGHKLCRLQLLGSGLAYLTAPYHEIPLTEIALSNLEGRAHLALLVQMRRMMMMMTSWMSTWRTKQEQLEMRKGKGNIQHDAMLPCRGSF